MAGVAQAQDRRQPKAAARDSSLLLRTLEELLVVGLESIAWS